LTAENIGAVNVEIRSSRQRAIQSDSKTLDKLLDEPDVKFEVLGDIFDTLALAELSLDLRYGNASTLKDRGAAELVRAPLDAIG